MVTFPLPKISTHFVCFPRKAECIWRLSLSQDSSYLNPILDPIEITCLLRDSLSFHSTIGDRLLLVVMEKMNQKPEKGYANLAC